MLIVIQYLVSYYERFGFKNQGASQAMYGGGGWHNMVVLISRFLDLSLPTRDDEEKPVGLTCP